MDKSLFTKSNTKRGRIYFLDQAIKAVAPSASVEVVLNGGLVKVEGVEDNAVIKKAVEDAGFTFEGEA